jgi:hypothetical protein
MLKEEKKNNRGIGTVCIYVPTYSQLPAACFSRGDESLPDYAHISAEHAFAHTIHILGTPSEQR